MMYINFIVLLTLTQLLQSIVSLLPTYNPLTRCHDLILPDEGLTFAICLQRASNKQHPFNLYTSPSFCSVNYPPNGHLIDLYTLSSSTIHSLFQSLTNLFNSKSSHIDLPQPNFIWISSNSQQNLTHENFLCPNQCKSNNQSGKFLILKTHCQFNNDGKPCITTKQTHWDRAPFICLTNQTIKRSIPPESIRILPSYPDDTIVFYDSTPCVLVRTHTHQYTFCFRRQTCPKSQTSAFCTDKFDAHRICQEEKNNSNLLTIENPDEYELINDVITGYSDETLLNSDGIMKKYIVRAQWMWIDGIKDLNDTYYWNINENNATKITDNYWCDNRKNCSGGKGRDHVVLNIVCHLNKHDFQVCLSSRRQSEPGPFICKRTLTSNEVSISNYTFLKNSTLIKTTSASIEKNLTLIYYDEHHCLTVQTQTYIYTFCLRRQNCTNTKAFCTKWSRAQKDCRILKNDAQLLTIDNEQERILVSDIMKTYLNETRLTFNGSSYRYYRLADFLWIDGVRQADNRTYLWKNGLETIPENLWCPKSQCISRDLNRVTLNLSCNKSNPLLCLGTRCEWRPAPYACKRLRPKDHCPLLLDKIRYNQRNEMLIINTNRTRIVIQCKHPEYSTDVKVQYHCNNQTNQWELNYENKKLICPEYVIPPMAISASTTSSRVPYFLSTPSSTMQGHNCSQSELSSIIAHIPTDSRYVYSQKLASYSSLHYDMRVACYFNNSIEVIYRCDLSTNKWNYIHGSTERFRTCSPPCDNNERNNLLNKYFTQSQQTKIRTIYIRKKKVLRLRCFNTNENLWKSINYQCGKMSITKYQWFKLHSCFQPTLTTTTVLPPVMVAMHVTQFPPACPPVIIHGNPCEYQIGQNIMDINGCTRKVCPSLSQLCNTIRCPPERICRVIPCAPCIHTGYLQAVCEYPSEPTLCELEKRLFLFNDYESINRWERQTIATVHQYAKEQRQRILSSWPILTIK